MQMHFSILLSFSSLLLFSTLHGICLADDGAAAVPVSDPAEEVAVSKHEPVKSVAIPPSGGNGEAAEEEAQQQQSLNAQKPAYLSVKGFDKCLELTQIGESQHWCLPDEKMENCDEKSWASLNEDNDTKVPKCPDGKSKNIHVEIPDAIGKEEAAHLKGEKEQQQQNEVHEPTDELLPTNVPNEGDDNEQSIGEQLMKARKEKAELFPQNESVGRDRVLEGIKKFMAQQDKGTEVPDTHRIVVGNQPSAQMPPERMPSLLGEQRQPTGGAQKPAYLNVEGFDKCLEKQVIGTAQLWCLPVEKPVDCDDASWAQLNNEEMGMPKCPVELEPQPKVPSSSSPPPTMRELIARKGEATVVAVVPQPKEAVVLPETAEQQQQGGQTMRKLIQKEHEENKKVAQQQQVQKVEPPAKVQLHDANENKTNPKPIAGAPAPPYLSVSGFSKCLKTIKTGLSKSYCMPKNKPRSFYKFGFGCKQSTWKELQEPRIKSSVDPCPEKVNTPKKFASKSGKHQHN